MNQQSAGMFYLNGIKRRKAEGNFIENGFTESYICFACKSGIGELFLDQQRYVLQAGVCALLPPGKLMELRANEGHSLELIMIEFEMLKESLYSTSGKREFDPIQEWHPQYTVLSKQHARVVSKIIFELGSLAEKSAQLWSYDTLLLFHQMIFQLHKSEHNIQFVQSNAAIEHTIQQMKQHISKNWNRDELARMAGMSPWHYSHTFKRHTGESPIRFLANIRMTRAKELLIGGMRLREICEEIGYHDEAHFRRAFKEATGQLPSTFARSEFNRIATVSYSYTAHLLSLGINPIAAPIDPIREPHRLSYHNQIQYPLIRKRYLSMEKWRENARILKLAEPQLIICDDLVPHEMMQELHDIAPTIVIPWMEDNWKQQFLHIATILRREHRAEEWMHAYYQKAEEVGKAVRAKLNTHRLSIIHLMLGKIVVYGNRNGGAVLYQDLKLTAAHSVEDIIVCKAITINELQQYAGEHILLIIDEDEASSMLWQQLQQHDQWTALRAVQEQWVYRLHEVPWLEYSPLAHELILQQIEEIFIG